MTDRPVLIPTSEGPVGGIVSEPGGEERAVVVILAGYGRPARSGVNSFWTRLARSFAELGALVLRFDYSREGETLPIGEGKGGQIWKRDLDLLLLEQVFSWLRERSGDTPVYLVGSCSGGRLAIELAGRRPKSIAGSFLVVPYVQALAEPGRESREEIDDLESVDPLVVDCYRAILDRAPSQILIGDHDRPDIPRLRKLLGQTPHDLEVEVVPGVALHLLDQPPLQDRARSWLLSEIAGQVSGSERANAGSAP